MKKIKIVSPKDDCCQILAVLNIILLELLNGMGVCILPDLLKRKKKRQKKFCKQNHFTLAIQYEEFSSYQMQGRFLQSLMLMFLSSYNNLIFFIVLKNILMLIISYNDDLK